MPPSTRRRLALLALVTLVLTALSAGLGARTQVLAGGPYPDAATGYDISWPQCGSAYPPPGPGIGIVGVNDGHPFSTNPCLGSEWAWARTSPNPPAVYLNTDWTPTGVAGPCTANTVDCHAYNYGVSAAGYSISVAQSNGIHAAMWWLDVETSNNWFAINGVHDTLRDSEMLQGMIDDLHAWGLTVGIYSTPYQYGVLMGSYQPLLPVWVPDFNDNNPAGFCVPAESFGGGAVWQVQWGNTQFDNDYSCAGVHGPYHPLPPGRLLDTRCGFGGTRLGPGGTLTLDVTGHLLVGQCREGALSGVPAGAAAVVVNITAVNPSATTFITAYPTGTARPPTSDLNTGAGGVVANLVEVTVGSGNGIRLFNASGSVDLVVDVEGYVGPGTDSSGLFHSLKPARICDTRPGMPSNQCNTPAAQTLGPGAIKTIQVRGMGGIPSAGVSGVVLNVTATNTTAPGYLAVWPSGPTPTASNLNFSANQTVANRVSVAINPTTGTVNVFNPTGDTDLIIDVSGYFTDSTVSTGSLFTPLSPIRVCDTRAGSGLQCQGMTVAPGGTLNVSLRGTFLPSNATAVVLNLTVVAPTSATWVLAYPGGGPSPSPPTSDVNAAAGETVANMVVVSLGSDGTVNVLNLAGRTDVLIDVAGWYS